MRAMAAALLITMTGAPALAAGPDSPVARSPTSGAEIAQGYKDGAACPPQLPELQLGPCFDRLRDRYKQSNPAPWSYEIGLRYRQWEAAYSQAQPHEKGYVPGPAPSLSSIACLQVVDAAEHAGVTHAQALEAIGPAAVVSADRWRLCIGPEFAARP